MPQFLKLTSGAIINLAHVVQLTPPGHLQVSSGNVLFLNSEDVAAVEAALCPPERDWNAYLASYRPPFLVDEAATLSKIADELPPPPASSEPVVLQGFGRSLSDPAEPSQT